MGSDGGTPEKWFCSVLPWGSPLCYACCTCSPGLKPLWQLTLDAQQDPNAVASSLADGAQRLAGERSQHPDQAAELAAGDPALKRRQWLSFPTGSVSSVPVMPRLEWLYTLPLQEGAVCPGLLQGWPCSPESRSSGHRPAASGCSAPQPVSVPTHALTPARIPRAARKGGPRQPQAPSCPPSEPSQERPAKPGRPLWAPGLLPLGLLASPPVIRPRGGGRTCTHTHTHRVLRPLLQRSQATGCCVWSEISLCSLCLPLYWGTGRPRGFTARTSSTKGS